MVASPTEVTGLIHRWVASSITGVADGAAVASWPGAVGNVDLAQGTAGNRPVFVASAINGKPAVRFDGTDWLSTSAAQVRPQPVTYYVVFKPTDTSGIKTIINNGAELQITPAGYTIWSGGTDVSTGAGTVTTNPTVMQGVFWEPDYSGIYINGKYRVQANSGPNGVQADFNLGYDPYFPTWGYVGDIAEVLVYDKYVKTAERARIATYMQDTYGITMANYVPEPIVAEPEPVPEFDPLALIPPAIVAPKGPAVWGLFSRDANYRVSGGLPLSSAQFVTRHIGVDTAVAETPYTEDSYVRTSPGCGIVLERDGEHQFSGKVESRTITWDRESGAGTIKLQAVGDLDHLAGRLVYPDRTRSGANQTTTDYWSYTGPASSAMWKLISESVGPEARTERRLTELTMGDNPGTGASRPWKAQFETVLATLASFAELSGVSLGVRMTQVAGGLRADIYEPRDLGDSIRFSPDLSNLVGFSYTETAPESTYDVAAGQGDLKLRMRRESTTTNPLDLRWGMRREVYIDRRDEADGTELQRAADDAIIEGQGQVSLTCTLTDSEAATYGRDWGLGDKVTVYVKLPGQAVAAIVRDVVREIHFEIRNDGSESISPAIGTTDAKAIKPSQTQQQLAAIGKSLEGLITRK